MWFGHTVALDAEGRTALVLAFSNGTTWGYVHELTNGTWQRRRIVQINGGGTTVSGGGVALSGDGAVGIVGVYDYGGAYDRRPTDFDQGAAFVYDFG
jgi:hypothetical protein